MFHRFNALVQLLWEDSICSWLLPAGHEDSTVKCMGNDVRIGKNLSKAKKSSEVVIFWVTLARSYPIMQLCSINMNQFTTTSKFKIQIIQID